tara:strand:- start:15702 stop:16211 length:510 start_codon:yes stop_codon:yes gene_type:complete
MKRLLLPLMLATYLPAVALAASDSATMDVSLNNIASVSVLTSPIDFGDVPTSVNFPTATGSITVNASGGVPYNIAIDGGLDPTLGGGCRIMNGPSSAARGYSLYTDSGHTTGWGDADFDNSCAGLGDGSDVSKAGTGTGGDQIHTVFVQAFAGASVASMSDTLTVTVYY